MAPIRVALAGVGNWGINHVRVFARSPLCDVTWLCDASEAALERGKSFASEANLTCDFGGVVAADNVDAIVLATPAVTHADLAVQALNAGKHVFVEKPLALNAVDAGRVTAAAEASGKRVMVGHLMLYHPAVDRLKEMLDSGELGNIYYLYASRVNLGRLRTDENALWSFAPHDLSMIDYLLGELPISVAARGECYLQKGIEDVVFMTLKFAGGQMAHVHLSWLDPHKERKLTVVGSRKMVVFDDVSSEKLRIYDKGYDRPPSFDRYEEYLTIRHGDVLIPRLRMSEPLAAECEHFLTCIRDGKRPRTDLASAVRVVRVLEAAQKSLEVDGVPVAL